MRTKGQTATEYLIILAVVIIIALIVVAVLGGIPGIGKGAANKASAAYWKSGSTGISIPQYVAFTATDDLNISIQNNLMNTISLTTVRVGGGTLTCAQTSLASGQTTVCSDGTGAGATVCGVSGDAFSLSVSITYIDKEVDATYTFTGDGHKLEGTCAE